MQININRSKADLRSIALLKRNLKLRPLQIKMFFLVLAGIALFLYKGDNINNDSFSGDAMVAMLCWGAAIGLYVDDLYTKIMIDTPQAIMDQNNPAKQNAVHSVELNDTSLIYDSAGNHVRINWSTFTAFRIMKKHIFLYRTPNNTSNSFIIKQSELTPPQFDEFYAFLKGRMEEVK